MKKLFASIMLVLLLIFCCGSMAACNDGFELVKAITITSNGEEKKFGSSIGPAFSLSSQTNISEEEFNNAPQERKLYSAGSSGLTKFSKVTVDDAIKAAKNSTRYVVVEKELEGEWYFNFFRMEIGQFIFYKCSYQNTHFGFVYVKVKNDTTVVIKNSSSETTYTVTSYTISKF